jgi:hypothetical protein
MPGDGGSLEDRIEAIERRLEAIEHRLAGGASETAASEHGPESEEAGAGIGEASIVSIVGLIGRTLIVLGGAFLIRFMTESKMLPQLAGTVLGIAYALLWVLLANRAARGDAYESATFHGVSAAIIGFPLFWETTLKFRYLTPVESAAALTLFTSVPLAVAWFREMRGFALVIGAPAAATMLALGFATRTLPPFVVALLLLGLATLLLAYDRQWYLLAAIVALIADFGIAVAAIVRLARPDGEALTSLGPAFLCAALAALGAVYLGTFSFLVFLRRRNLEFLEVAQVVAVLAVGLGGFAATAVAFPSARPALGSSVFVLAAACYVGAYPLLREERASNRTFMVYSAAAAAAGLVAACLSFRGGALSVVLAVGALVCSAAGSRMRSVSLGVHGALYVSAAAVSSGLLWETIAVLSGAELVPEMWWRVAPWCVFFVSAAVVLLRPGTADVLFERRFRGVRLPALALTALTLGAVVVSAAFGLVAEIGERELTESSVLRTAVLAGSAVLLALLSRRERFAQARWLVIPWLLFGGAKLAAQDLPSGKPSVLFGSLAIYGAALIVAPRLLRRAA